ncbi:MAG: elongation factor P--(R)-beta-lysine ligase [Legionellaceae bacterium]|nr:elongation factor P--(R)-beta-lysine ligase [Legionellaceae bacterium]
MECDQSWRPSATMESLRRRAHTLANIRTFFTERGYLEVETPVMARHGITDVYLSNIKAFFRAKPYCLQTSPEYHMKRLLAAGSGPIFQLARVFRDDELGRWHNPEFTLLEWYQLDIDHHGLMNEMDTLLQGVLGCLPLVKKTYQQIFLDSCQIDPMSASVLELRDCLTRFDLRGVFDEDESDRDHYLFLLMSHVVEPALASESAPIAVYDFPVTQASLAKISHGVAERFEVYYRGVELANGFHELTDPAMQLARFEEDRAIRKARGFDDVVIDDYLLQALRHGLPPCSGVALGIDRLLALACSAPSISSCLSFDWSRA